VEVSEGRETNRLPVINVTKVEHLYRLQGRGTGEERKHDWLKQELGMTTRDPRLTVALGTSRSLVETGGTHRICNTVTYNFLLNWGNFQDVEMGSLR